MPKWLKILIAIVLMGALAFTMDWRSLRVRAADLDWLIASVAFIAIVLEMPVNAAKWYWSLRLHGQRFPWRYLFHVGCIGYFFNNFLPSAIGGDVYRVYRTWPAEGDKAFAVSAVFVERLVGVCVLMVNGCIGALLVFDQPLARAFVYASLIGAGVALVGLPLLAQLHRRGALSRRFAKLASVEVMLGRILAPRIEWLWLIVASFAFQGLAAGVVYLCFAAVGSSIDVPSALLITAAAGLASVLPISISGLGVVEGSIAGTAVALGGSYEAAVLAALLLRALALGVSALCGLCYFIDDGQRIQSTRLDVAVRSPASPSVLGSRTPT